MSRRFVSLLAALTVGALGLAYGLAVPTERPVTSDGGSVVPAQVPLCSFSVVASGLSRPGPMTFRGSDLYVATHDFATDTITIVKITPSGVASVFATINAAGSALAGFAFPTDLALDGSGNLYVAVGNNNPGKYWTVTPGGTASSASSNTGRGPSSIEIDSTGNVYVTDAFADVILKNGGSFATSSGDVAFANGLLWNAATLYALVSVSVQQVSPTGSFSLVANLGTISTTFALQPGTGDFYFLNADGSPDFVAKVSPSGPPTNVCSLGFDDNWPAADLEFGPDGALYLSDSPNGRVLKISVQTPSQAVGNLVNQVNGLNIPQGAKTSLTAKLNAALRSLANGNTDAAKGQLQAFINEVNAKCCVPHPGKVLTRSEADALIAAAESILASLS